MERLHIITSVCHDPRGGTQDQNMEEGGITQGLAKKRCASGHNGTHHGTKTGLGNQTEKPLAAPERIQRWCHGAQRGTRGKEAKKRGSLANLLAVVGGNNGFLQRSGDGWTQRRRNYKTFPFQRQNGAGLKAKTDGQQSCESSSLCCRAVGFPACMSQFGWRDSPQHVSSAARCRAVDTG